MHNWASLIAGVENITGGIKPLKIEVDKQGLEDSRTSDWWGNFVNKIVNAHAPIKGGTVFGHCCIFVWTRSGRAKTIQKRNHGPGERRKNGEKNLHFQAKTDTCGRGLRVIRAREMARGAFGTILLISNSPSTVHVLVNRKAAFYESSDRKRLMNPKLTRVVPLGTLRYALEYPA